MQKSIPVIDLFAGPGGLSEGFSRFQDESGNNPFKVVLSIEKDPIAHKTLELRSLFRFLDRESDPSDYFSYIRRDITREDLLKRHKSEAKKAKNACWLAELGSPDLPYSEIKERINMTLTGNSMWLLIGGPPCQAYSVIGRSRVKSVEPERYENDHRHFLYKEYLKIVADHSPPVFLMENVKGLLSTEINGSNMFSKIVKDLEAPRTALAGSNPNEDPIRYQIFSLSTNKPNCSLKAKDYIVKSELYGIPQKRHRVFLLGIRSDILHVFPDDMYLEKKPAPVSVEEVIGDLPKLRSGLSKIGSDSFSSWSEVLSEIVQAEWFMSKQIDMKVKKEIEKAISHISSDQLTRGGEFIDIQTNPSCLNGWYADTRLLGVYNHSTRSHITQDLYRYLYASCFVRVYGYSPELPKYPISLLPLHQNVKPKDGNVIFSDRFRVQIGKQPSSTITSHISKDGHYYIHPDPTQCRSLTVREAARLQTFPDNYFFEGSRTDQYRQVGNAVPPFLAYQIAGNIFKLFCNIIEGHVDEK